MKIHNEEIKMDSAKVILSKNPFKLIHNICLENDITIIAPWTKLSDIFNYKKNNFLANMIGEEFEELSTNIINYELILKTISEIEDKHGFEFIDLDERGAKVVKDHLIVSDTFINPEYLLKIIKYINRYSRMKTSIILIGFDEQAKEIIKNNLLNIDIVIIANSLKNINIDIKYIEALIIETGNNDLLQVFDITILQSWLESKTSLSLTTNDIEDYFNNIINNKTILIEKAIQNI